MKGKQVNFLSRPHPFAAVEHQPIAELDLIDGLPDKLNPLILAWQTDEQRVVESSGDLITSARADAASGEWPAIKPLDGRVHPAASGEDTGCDILRAIRNPIHANQTAVGDNEGIATNAIAHRGRRISVDTT